MEEKIYIFKTGVRWKSISSISDFWVGTSYEKLIEAVQRAIEARYIEYRGVVCIADQLEYFKEDAPILHGSDHNEAIRHLNNIMEYGLISVHDNNSYC